MAKINFNSRRCIGCRACEGACKQEHDLPVGVKWRVVTGSLAGEYPRLIKNYKSVACRHCAQPVCIKVCPAGALLKEEKRGIVMLAENKCTGCRACVEACPFKAMSFDRQKNKAAKCTMCMHRLEAGLVPACVQSCMGVALHFEE